MTKSNQVQIMERLARVEEKTAHIPIMDEKLDKLCDKMDKMSQELSQHSLDSERRYLSKQSAIIFITIITPILVGIIAFLFQQHL